MQRYLCRTLCGILCLSLLHSYYKLCECRFEYLFVIQKQLLEIVNHLNYFSSFSLWHAIICFLGVRLIFDTNWPKSLIEVGNLKNCT